MLAITNSHSVEALGVGMIAKRHGTSPLSVRMHTDRNGGAPLGVSISARRNRIVPFERHCTVLYWVDNNPFHFVNAKNGPRPGAAPGVYYLGAGQKYDVFRIAGTPRNLTVEIGSQTANIIGRISGFTRIIFIIQ